MEQVQPARSVVAHAQEFAAFIGLGPGEISAGSYRLRSNIAHALQAPAAENASEPDAAACLFGTRAALADFAIVPFVRQFARQDMARFAAHAPPPVVQWMDRLLARPDFEAVMTKRPVWSWRGAPV